MNSTGMDYLFEKARSQYTNWQKEVVYDQGLHGVRTESNKDIWEPIENRQHELRAAIQGGHRILGAYLRQVLEIGDREVIAPPFPRRQLTADEFRTPPRELEWEMWKGWADVTPRLASRPLFWLLCHIAWIEEGRLGYDGNELAMALTTGGRSGNEAETRNFLRRTGGIPHERGKTSVFSDCPLARAWWRCHMAMEVSGATGSTVSREDAHLVLCTNRQTWERLAMLSIQRLVVLNQPSVRATVVACLQQRLQAQRKIGDSDVQEIASACAQRGLRRSFEHMLGQN